MRSGHSWKKNIYQLDGPAEKRRIEGILRLRNDLFSHYASLSEEERAKISTLEDLTPKMVGNPTKRRLKTKAAETKALVPFVVAMCRKHAPRLGREGRLIELAGISLDRFLLSWTSKAAS